MSPIDNQLLPYTDTSCWDRVWSMSPIGDTHNVLLIIDMSWGMSMQRSDYLHTIHNQLLPYTDRTPKIEQPRSDESDYLHTYIPTY
jgi:hypothetical protein